MAGRKRKFMTRTERRERNRARQKIKPTSEQDIKFRLIVGRDRYGSQDNALGSPLTVLAARGMLDDTPRCSANMMVTAGHVYGFLYWSVIGVPLAKTPYYGDMIGRGSVAMPSDVIDEDEERREIRFKAMTDRLRTEGRDVERAVKYAVVDFNLPDWYLRAIEGTMTTSDLRDRDNLMTGLKVLVTG